MKKMLFLIGCAVVLFTSLSIVGFLRSSAQNSVDNSSQGRRSRNTEKNAEILNELEDNVKNNGTIKIIIGLQTNYIREDLLDKNQVIKQRSQITLIQNEFAEILKSNRATNIKSFANIPFLRATVDLEMLRLLIDDARVMSLQEDKFDSKAVIFQNINDEDRIFGHLPSVIGSGTAEVQAGSSQEGRSVTTPIEQTIPKSPPNIKKNPKVMPRYEYENEPGDTAEPTSSPVTVEKDTKIKPETGAANAAPNDMTYFRTHDMTTAEAPLNARSVVSEPSVVNAGSAVFYTANWFAARSLDGGQTFSYLNPLTTFPSANGGFCCDQVTAYAPSQDMIIWGLQYVHDGSTNTYRIARTIGSSGLGNNQWIYWSWTPQQFNLPTGVWFDFPTMAVSSGHLYITLNVFNMGNPEQFVGCIIWRMPLAQLAAGGTVNSQYIFFDFAANGFGSLRLAEGAGDTMHWVTLKYSGNQPMIRSFHWADSSNQYTFHDTVISPFNSLNRNGIATSPDGTNWAARADSRILASYLSNGMIGAMWGAAQGGNFPYPYTIHARVNATTGALVSQTPLWNSSFAWLYPATTVNSAGNVGGIVNYGGGQNYPNSAIWAIDDVSPSLPIGTAFVATTSNNGPSGNSWGDYLTVRPNKDFPNTWVAAMHYLTGGQSNFNAIQRYLWFGRERDGPSTGTSTLQFSSSNYSVNENGGSAVITVTRTGGTNAVSINYATSNGTATAGLDYTATSGTLNFASGENSKTFSVPIIDDLIVEGNETVNLTLSNPSSGATTGTPGTAVLTIIDNDTAPPCTYTINPTNRSFGASGGTNSFNVTAPSGCNWTAAVTSSLFENVFSNYAAELKTFDGTPLLSPSAVFPANAGTLGAVPDGPGAAQTPGTPRDVTFTVSGITGSISNVEISLTGTHTYIGDLQATLIAPNGTSHRLFGYTGALNATSFGDGSDLNGTYVFKDSASPPSGGWWQEATARTDVQPLTNGNYRTTNSGGTGATNPMPATNINATFAGVANANGTWTLRITDGAAQDTGSVTAASLTIDGGTPTNWLTITSGSSGSGNGTVNYSVASSSVSSRTGTITVSANGQPQATHTVTQTSTPPPPSSKAMFDFDGDNRTDIGIFRPGMGQWWYQRSLDNGSRVYTFGQSTDRLVPADYTGDGKADVAYWRPSTGEWAIIRSENDTYYAFPFGGPGDIPAPGDFDGDGRADPAVFRPSNATWYIQKSSGGVDIIGFGVNGDQPVVADYDGDSRADIAIYRPSNSQWWLRRSSQGIIAYQFGGTGDKTVQADYTGDGKADIAFWRPSTGFWYVLRSEDSSFYAFPFGANGDMPTPGDFDGDSRSDPAVFRPSNSVWYINRTSSGVTTVSYGTTGDIPIAGAYVR